MTEPLWSWVQGLTTPLPDEGAEWGPTCAPADRQMFLATWKDIPNENEAQFQIRDCPLNAGRAPEPCACPCCPVPCPQP